MTTNATDNVALKGPEDWEAWNTQFKSKAISTNIWKLINPNEDGETVPFAVEPDVPEIGNYDKRIIPQAPAQATRSSAGPQNPVEEVDHGARPRNVSEMTTAARQAFQLDITLYQLNFKKYTAERDALDKLRNWVLKTVSEHLVRTACDPEDTLKGCYAKLKEQVGVLATTTKREARAQYKAAIKPLAKAPRDPIAWLNNWEEIVTLAKEKKVLDTEQVDLWFEDFSVAVRGFMKEWIRSYKIMHATDIKGGTLTFRKLANNVRNELKKAQLPKTRVIAKGAFGPSYADVEDPPEQPAKDEQVQKGKGKGKGKNKRKMTTGESSAKCPACNAQGHTLENCLYIFPKKARGKFTPRRDQQAEVDKRLQDNSQLQKEVDRLQGKRPKEGEATQNQQD